VRALDICTAFVRPADRCILSMRGAGFHSPLTYTFAVFCAAYTHRRRACMVRGPVAGSADAYKSRWKPVAWHRWVSNAPLLECMGQRDSVGRRTKKVLVSSDAGGRTQGPTGVCGEQNTGRDKHAVESNRISSRLRLIQKSTNKPSIQRKPPVNSVLSRNSVTMISSNVCSDISRTDRYTN
jgi:hypothetical protein